MFRVLTAGNALKKDLLLQFKIEMKKKKPKNRIVNINDTKAFLWFFLYSFAYFRIFLI